jgi:hypothetical protein
LFGLSPGKWILLVAVLLSALIAFVIWQYHRDCLPIVPMDAFGRAQLLFLFLLWFAVIADFTRAFPGMKSKSVLFVHVTFWLTAMLCTLIVFVLPKRAEEKAVTTAFAWRLSWKYGLIWATIPLLLFALAKLSLGMHSEPLPGSQLRFETKVEGRPQ